MRAIKFKLVSGIDYGRPLLLKTNLTLFSIILFYGMIWNDLKILANLFAFKALFFWLVKNITVSKELE